MASEKITAIVESIKTLSILEVKELVDELQNEFGVTAMAPVAGGAVKVTSPMPGTILNVKVSVGQSVKKGDVICVLEAMKMENDIPAPQDGVIASINTQKGASVNAGDVLASLN